MDTAVFTFENEDGSLTVTGTITENPDGSLTFTFQVDDSEPGAAIGDLRGLFMEIDESLFDTGTFSVNGDDVTDYQFGAESVSDLGNGANMQGIPITPFDIGVEIGTEGASPDDIQSTSFTLSHSTEDLTVEDILELGLRINSVGPEDGDRGGSEKLTTVPVLTGSIEGTKYYDQNDNDTIDGGDIALAGWEVKLFAATADGDGNGTLDADEIDAATAEQTTTTDASGEYEFTAVKPGDYFVVETVPSGWTANGPTQHAVTVESGEVYGDEAGEATDFLNISSVDIRGTKYEDFNADGIVNGSDAGLAGWDIKVWFDDGDGVFEGAGEDTLVTTQTTDGNGDWSATLTSIGTYFVEEDLSAQSGWSQSGPGTSPNEGFYEVEVGYDMTGPTLTVDATVDSDGDGYANDGSVNVGDLDFLNWEPGSIEGTKYYDQNDNDTIDGGDIALAGWEVKLFAATADGDGNGTLDADEIDAATAEQTTTTDASGEYEFTAVKPGDYFVVETVPSGWTANGPTQHAVTVESGEVYGDEAGEATDFLNISSVDIRGTKYEDFNADGIVNGSDAGLAGWDIKVWFDDGDGVFEGAGEDTLVTTQTTDGNGDWSATLTSIGTYFVEEDLSAQSGWSQSGPGTSPNEGFYEVEVGYDMTGPTLTVDATVDSDGDGYANDGSVNVGDLDFLNWESFDISGYKWGDLDGDQNWDAGEVGLAGWTITLDIDNDGTIDDTTVTDVNGFYEFTDLEAGTTYAIAEVQQLGWLNTFDGSTVIVGVSGEDQTGDLGVAEDLNFGNQMLEGAVRTPGFWKSKLGQTYWDGDQDNDGILKDGQQQKEGSEFPEFPENDLVYENLVDLDGDGVADDYGLLVGDWNGNGITDEGENTRLYTLDEALAALVVEDKNGPASGKGGPRDAYTILERDLIASWLNHLNDNPDGSTGSDPSTDDMQASYWMDQAVQWLNAVDNPGAPNRPIRTSTKYWKEDGKLGDDIEAGQDSHKALDSWNNDGIVTVDGNTEVTAFDADNLDTEAAQAWLDAYGSNLSQDTFVEEFNVFEVSDGGDLA